jgi:ketosteroid isomerase-like protein
MHDRQGDPVRAMWVAYREGDVEAALPLLDPEVEFVTSDGQVLRGAEEVRRFFRGFEERGQRFSAQPYSFERHGDCWIVVGNRRIRTQAGTSDEHLYFVHVLRDGVIVRLAAYPTREGALRALDPS